MNLLTKWKLIVKEKKAWDGTFKHTVAEITLDFYGFRVCQAIAGVWGLIVHYKLLKMIVQKFYSFDIALPTKCIS